jgi:pyruvate ferredoxin oxidoreductase delta subunit
MADLKKKDEMKPGGVAPAGTMSQLYTGSWRTYVPVTDYDKCIHCLVCWVACPDGAIQVEDGKKVGTDLQHCKGCGICATECPVDAIEIKLESDIPEGGQKG